MIATAYAVAVEAHPLKDRVEITQVGLGADGLRPSGVLDREDRFVRGDERVQVCSISLFSARFIDRKVKITDQVFDLGEVVLQSDR